MPLDLSQSPQQVTVSVDQSLVVVESTESAVNVACLNQQIDVETEENLVEVRAGGPKGDKGADGDAGILALPIGETIHGQRAVRAVDGLIYHPNVLSVSHAAQVIGIAMQSGSIPSTLSVRTRGPMSDPSWNWSAGLVYCADAGVLTQSPGAAGWLLPIGRAIDPTTIDIDIDTAFLRI